MPVKIGKYVKLIGIIKNIQISTASCTCDTMTHLTYLISLIISYNNRNYE
jgi:hypothetical protein